MIQTPTVRRLSDKLENPETMLTKNGRAQCAASKFGASRAVTASNQKKQMQQVQAKRRWS